MDTNLHINRLHGQFCNRFKITENGLKDATLDLFLSTDFENYFSIKFLSKQINSLFLMTSSNSTTQNKILLAIANIIGYKNHHDMKSKIISKMLEDNSNTAQDIHDIFRINGIKGLLPQHLPDYLLKLCSIEFEAYQENNIEIGVSGLFTIISLIMLNERFTTTKNRSLSFSMTPEELDSKFCSYGVELSLEGLCRIGVISVSKDTLPNEYNIFNDDRKKESTLNLSHPENLKRLFS